MTRSLSLVVRDPPSCLFVVLQFVSRDRTRCSFAVVVGTLEYRIPKETMPTIDQWTTALRSDAARLQGRCIVCEDRAIATVLLPCAHQVIGVWRSRPASRRRARTCMCTCMCMCACARARAARAERGREQGRVVHPRRWRRQGAVGGRAWWQRRRRCDGTLATVSPWSEFGPAAGAVREGRRCSGF